MTKAQFFIGLLMAALVIPLIITVFKAAFGYETGGASLQVLSALAAFVIGGLAHENRVWVARK